MCHCQGRKRATETDLYFLQCVGLYGEEGAFCGAGCGNNENKARAELHKIRRELA